MKYDLERLGPFGFQDLASALALKALGAQVQRMGAGRDGGRDMLVTNGQIVWAGNDDAAGEVWGGTTVFQAKHKSTLEGPAKDVAWGWAEIRKELDAWSALDSDRPDVPDFLLFATNVPLTPFPEKGGWDTIHRNIRKYLDGLDDNSAEDHLPKGPDRRQAREDREARRDRMTRLKNVARVARQPVRWAP